MRDKLLSQSGIIVLLGLAMFFLVSCGRDDAPAEVTAAIPSADGEIAIEDGDPELPATSPEAAVVAVPPTPDTGEIAAMEATLLAQNQQVDACLLVSETEAAAFLGGEIISVENEPGDHIGVCKYTIQTIHDRPHLKISWTPNYGRGDYDLVRSMVQNPREIGTELGDEYYIRDELTGVQIRVVRGEQYLVLEAFGTSEPDEPLKELTRRLLAVIPPG